jgi:rod shape-determining protein MreD
MSTRSAFPNLYFVLTVVVAMVLRIMDVIPGLAEFNPDWVVLALIYWSVALPDRFGVFTAFAVGLFTDVLTGHLLGQSALIYSILIYLAMRQHRRLRQFPIAQQCSFIFFCLLCGQSLVFGMESMQVANRLPVSFWYPVVTGTLVWPLVFRLLRTLRVFARIS